MRHPIDDIFKKGIGQEEYSFTQEEWMKAKEMLDLEKHKKRIPLWWFGVAAGILLGAIVLFPFRKSHSDIRGFATAESHGAARELSKSEVDPLTDTISIDIVNDSEIRNVKKEKTDRGIKIGEKVGVSVKLKVESVSISEEANVNAPTGKTAQIRLSKKDNTLENKESIVNVSAESSLNPSSSLPHVQSLPIIGFQNENLNPSGDKIAVLNENKIPSIDATSQLIIAYLQKEITALEIKGFIAPEIILPHNYKIKSAKEVKQNLSSFDIYTAYTIPQSKPSIGLMLNRNIAGRWIASIGTGVAYHKSRSFNVASELNLIDVSGFAQASQVSEDVMFRQITLEIPVNLGYRLGRHSIFTTALAEMNLWSELIRDAIVSSNNRQDIPADPAFDLSDPVTITQQSKTINERSLSIPKYYIGLGYGLEISRKLSLQTQGLWNLSSSQEIIESAFAANQQSSFTESRWHLRTSLLLRF
ncbi:MAG: hypothetical protein ACJA01_003616 [Saprospiraceae bacterium]|jgi:hypothetical protein